MKEYEARLNDDDKVKNNSELSNLSNEQINKILIDNALKADKTNFILSDLFNSEEWEKYSTSDRIQLGKKFVQLIEENRIPQIKADGKTSGNIQRYKVENESKKSALLAPTQESILVRHAGVEQGLSAKQVAMQENIHIEKAKLFLEELEDLGYLESEYDRYNLSKAGRFYLVQRNLLN